MVGGASPSTLAVVKMDSAFTELPGSGYLPVRVQITNRSRQTHYYRIESTGQASYGDSGARRDERKVQVGAGQSQTFEVLVPMPPQDGGGVTWCNIEVKVSGGPGGTWTGQRSARLPRSSGGQNATVGFGTGLPDPSAHLSNAVPGNLHAIEVDPASLSEDWRGFIGLDALWLSTADANEIPTTSLIALSQWVAQGGALVLLGEQADIESHLLGFTAVQWREEAYGLGRLHRLRIAASGPEPLAETLSSLRARVIVSEHASRVRRMVKQGGVQTAVPAVEVQRGWIISFLLGLVLLIGPINLFVFAPKQHRMRLLWSTPALSVGVSVILMVAIVFQDGVGGEGAVAQVVLQMPEAHSEHIFQVQAGRTGLVVSGGFDLGRDVHLELLPTGTPPDEVEDRRLERDEDAASGDWFLTRSRQAQLLQSVRPSRSTVVRMNPGEEPPRIRSNQAAVLDTIYYEDEAGRSWRGADLKPGETVELQPCESTEALGLLDTAALRLPGHLNEAVRFGFPRKGWMMATASGQFAWLKTLRGGAWDSKPTFVLAPVLSKISYE